MDPSSLIEAVRRHLGGGEAPEPGVLRRALEARLADRRKRRGLRHELGPALSVLVAGAACGYETPLAIGQAAAGWGQEVLAAHGCRVSHRTGLRVAPSARTLYRIPQILDADEFEAALTSALADAALDPQVTAAAAAKRQAELGKKANKRKRKPPAAEKLREERDDGWFRPHPRHPWLDPALTGDPGHVPARPGVAVDGKERKGAKAGGKKKVHLLAAVTHIPGIVIAQDKVAKSGKPKIIPGLLQTAGYTTVMLEDARDRQGSRRDDIADAVAERVDRQQILKQAGHQFMFVIEEPVLRYRICDPGTLRDQLLHLRAVARLPQVRLGVIPVRADRRTVLPREGFVIFDEDLVTVELVSGVLSVTQPREIGMYLRDFTDLARVAVYGQAARNLITEALNDLS